MSIKFTFKGFQFDQKLRGKNTWLCYPVHKKYQPKNGVFVIDEMEVVPSSEPIPHKCKPVILQIPRTENNESTVAVKIEQDEITKPFDERISLPEVGENGAIKLEPTDDIGNKIDNTTRPKISCGIMEYLENRVMKKHTWVEICDGKLFCQVNAITAGI